jgi:histidinol-phosphate aminotransferase
VTTGGSFLKAALRAFEPYVPGQQPPDEDGWVKLNTNESPWPPSPRVLQAIRGAVDERLRLYPNPTGRAAREEIARHHGLEPEQVMVGNGGDELIELCFRAFAGAGDRVAFAPPTYPLFEPLCAIHEAVPVRHPLDGDWGLPGGFATDPAALKFLVNPNSPTGTWLDRERVAAVVEGSPGVLALDEAYVDFAPEDRRDLLAAGARNLLLLRTFSKSYALAGMRIGYALGDGSLIAALDLVKDSYNLDRLALVAAAAAIRDAEYHDSLVGFVVAERAWLAEQLRGAGFQVVPSAANFVFARPPAEWPAEEVHAALRERKVLVRHYDREPIAGWFRVSVGTREQHEALLKALKEVMA